MEDMHNCSLCMKTKAIQACKCSNKITLLCDGCMKVHLTDTTEEHNLLALYLAKYILNKKIIEKTRSLYTNECEELVEKLKAYMNTILTFRTDLAEVNKKIQHELQLHMNKSNNILNNVEKEIRSKIKILNVHSKKPFKEGLNIIETYRYKGFKKVLTVCPSVLKVSEKNLLKEVSNLIYIGDNTVREEEDLLLIKLNQYNRNIAKKQETITELEAKLAFYDDRLKCLTKEQTYLTSKLAKKDELISEFEQSLFHKNTQIKQLTAKINEMKEVLNSGYNYIQKLECDNSSLNSSVEDLMDRTMNLEQELRLKDEKLIIDQIHEDECHTMMNNTKQGTRKILEGVLHSLAETKKKLGSKSSISSKRYLETR
jgi:chromosome segregation ATPase